MEQDGGTYTDNDIKGGGDGDDNDNDEKANDDKDDGDIDDNDDDVHCNNTAKFNGEFQKSITSQMLLLDRSARPRWSIRGRWRYEGGGDGDGDADENDPNDDDNEEEEDYVDDDVRGNKDFGEYDDGHDE